MHYFVRHIYKYLVKKFGSLFFLGFLHWIFTFHRFRFYNSGLPSLTTPPSHLLANFAQREGFFSNKGMEIFLLQFSAVEAGH